MPLFQDYRVEMLSFSWRNKEDDFSRVPIGSWFPVRQIAKCFEDDNIAFTSAVFIIGLTLLLRISMWYEILQFWLFVRALQIMKCWVVELFLSNYTWANLKHTVSRFKAFLGILGIVLFRVHSTSEETNQSAFGEGLLFEFI